MKGGCFVVVVAPVGAGFEGHVRVEKCLFFELREEGPALLVETTTHEHDLHYWWEGDICLGKVLESIPQLGLVGHRQQVSLRAFLEEVKHLEGQGRHGLVSKQQLEGRQLLEALLGVLYV